MKDSADSGFVITLVIVLVLSLLCGIDFIIAGGMALGIVGLTLLSNLKGTEKLLKEKESLVPSYKGKRVVKEEVVKELKVPEPKKKKVSGGSWAGRR